MRWLVQIGLWLAWVLSPPHVRFRHVARCRDRLVVAMIGNVANPHEWLSYGLSVFVFRELINMVVSCYRE